MDKQTLLQKYLHSELNDEEYKVFIDLVDSDPDFAEDVKIESVLYAKHKQDIKQEILNTNKIKISSGLDVQKEKRKTLISIIRNVAAISILGLIMYICYTNIQSNSPSYQELVKAYISDTHVPPTTLRSSNDNETDFWLIGIQAYAQKDYDLAINNIQAISDRTNEQHLYLGLSKLYSTSVDPLTAIADFDHIIHNSIDYHKDEAMWYKSLILLEQGHQTDAIKILKELIEKKYWKYEDASLLLKSISE